MAMRDMLPSLMLVLVLVLVLVIVLVILIDSSVAASLWGA
jgi:hypothetical protein